MQTIKKTKSSKKFLINATANQALREKCEKLEKEKTELLAKMQAGDFIDLDTLHQVKQEKHKLQKEVVAFKFIR